MRLISILTVLIMPMSGAASRRAAPHPSISVRRSKSKSGRYVLSARNHLRRAWACEVESPLVLVMRNGGGAVYVERYDEAISKAPLTLVRRGPTGRVVWKSEIWDEELSTLLGARNVVV